MQSVFTECNSFPRIRRIGIRDNGLLISKERIAIRENGLYNLREQIAIRRTDWLIQGKDTQSKRTDCLNRVNEMCHSRERIV